VCVASGAAPACAGLLLVRGSRTGPCRGLTTVDTNPTDNWTVSGLYVHSGSWAAMGEWTLPSQDEWLRSPTIDPDRGLGRGRELLGASDTNSCPLRQRCRSAVYVTDPASSSPPLPWDMSRRDLPVFGYRLVAPELSSFHDRSSGSRANVGMPGRPPRSDDVVVTGTPPACAVLPWRGHRTPTRPSHRPPIPAAGEPTQVWPGREPRWH